MESLVGVVTAVTSAITGAVVSVVVVSSVVVVVSSVLLSLAHEMIVKLKRNMEKMMSICLTRVPITGLGKPKLYQNMWCFTRKGRLLRVGDSKEIY